MDWKKKIALIVVIIGSIVIILSGLSMVVPVHAAVAPESPGPNVIVNETGLPRGAVWVVSVSYFISSGAEIMLPAVSLLSGGNTIFSIPGATQVNISLAFSQSSPYIQTNYNLGAIIYGNESVSLTVIFQRIYSVTFIPVGLPSNEQYGVAIYLANSTNTNHAASTTYTQGNAERGLINGTYDYQVYAKTNASGENLKGASGSFVVNGHSLTVKVFFTSNAYQVITHDVQTVVKWAQQNWEDTLVIGVIFVVLGYLAEVGLPSREEILKDVKKAEKRRSKK